MPIVQARCLNCNGILSVDNTKEAAVCPYCDTPYIVEKAITNYNNYFVNQVEAPAPEIIIEGLIRDGEKCLQIKDYGLLLNISQKFQKEYPTDFHGYLYELIWRTNNFQYDKDNLKYYSLNQISYEPKDASPFYITYDKGSLHYSFDDTLKRTLSLSPADVKADVQSKMDAYNKVAINHIADLVEKEQAEKAKQQEIQRQAMEKAERERIRNQKEANKRLKKQENKRFRRELFGGLWKVFSVVITLLIILIVAYFVIGSAGSILGIF